MTECHLCKVEDSQMNLSRIRTQQGDVIYVHGCCLTHHNKTVKKNRCAMDAASVATEVSSRDLDATSSYVVAKFLREHNSEAREYLLDPSRRFDERFVDEVTNQARKERNSNAESWVFRQIEENVTAWPDETTEELLTGIVEDLEAVMERLARGDVTIETEAVRCAALLLIKQTAWRKRETELAEAYCGDDDEEVSS